MAYSEHEYLRRIDDGEFFLIAGPCVIESEELCLRVAREVAELANKHGIPFIFKSSYLKANRTSLGSPTGPGLDEGLKILQRVKDVTGLPVLTDVHETTEIEAVAEVVDIIQIPAFLCRQTALIVAATNSGRWVNIKKGQFLAPDDMAKVVGKAGASKLMLTERGASFGYHNLVVDFRSLLIMKELGHKIVYDVTHSLQLPSGEGDKSTGQPEFVIPMARAGVAIGVDGLFVETHPEPLKAWSDAGSMLPLKQMPQLLDSVMRVRKAVL